MTIAPLRFSRDVSPVFGGKPRPAEPPLENVRLFAGRSNPTLAKEIAAQVGRPLSSVNLWTHRDQECYVNFPQPEDIAGKDVFVIQSTSKPANKYLMELKLMIQALKANCAKSINLVLPYHGYARADRAVKPGEAVGAELVAHELEAAGANRVLTMDIHSPKAASYFQIPLMNIAATEALVASIRQMNLDNLMVVSPDKGGIERATAVANALNTPTTHIEKKRDKDTGKIIGMALAGNVQGKTVVLIDDMIDTAGTLVKAAALLKEHGATRVIAMATHGVLSDPAVENLKNSAIDEIVLTNTIQLRNKARKLDKIRQISVADWFGQAIRGLLQADAQTRQPAA